MPTLDPQTDPTWPGHPDPYPLYHQLRAAEPVHWSARMNGWVLTRYRDATAYLFDHRFSRRAYLAGIRERLGDSPLLLAQSQELAFMDAPHHTQVRRLVNQAFSQDAVQHLRPHIQQLVDAALDRLQSQGSMDVIGDFAAPLPAAVISEMLGVPVEDRERIRPWVVGLAEGRAIVRTTQAMHEGAEAITLLHDYFRDLAAQRRRQPRADLLSTLVAAQIGGTLREEEVLSIISSLFAAGQVTIKNLVGNAVLALLRHPDQFQLLVADLSRINSAIEEALRYDSPTQATNPQVATEDVTLGGQHIAKGQAVTILIGAVNRDPERFPDPDRFDITRTDHQHLAFSAGEHFCLGANLARLEAQLAVGMLVQRLPRLRLASDQLQWQTLDRFRGLVALPVAF